MEFNINKLKYVLLVTCLSVVGYYVFSVERRLSNLEKRKKFEEFSGTKEEDITDTITDGDCLTDEQLFNLFGSHEENEEHASCDEETGFEETGYYSDHQEKIEELDEPLRFIGVDFNNNEISELKTEEVEEAPVSFEYIECEHVFKSGKKKGEICKKVNCTSHKK